MCLVLFSLLSSVFLTVAAPVDVEVCPLGQFPCGNLSVCLAQPKHCNGQQDCPNGADEENCVDNSGWPHLFDAFMKTRVQEPKECMLDVYPDMCYCEGWKVNCNNKNLHHIPPMSSNVTALELNSNDLVSLHPDLFIRYRYLERLHLENNNIETISKRAFSGLFSLRKLFLSQNRISSLKAGSFTDLNSLEWLSPGLDSAGLSSYTRKFGHGVPPACGERLQWLCTMPEYRILDENRITFLRQKSFEGLKSLFFLSLLNNSVEQLPKTSLCLEMPHLNWLELEGNRISSLLSSTFKNCTSLTVLALRRNRISAIEDGTFSSMHQLIDLDLSINQILDLPPSLFHSLQNVRQLNISNNPLTHVYEDQFDSFINLQSLSMEEVEIPNISIRMFHFLGNLSHIYFKRFEYCTYSPNVRSCKPNTDGISSFENLLANIILRVFVWVVAFIICFGNVFVICLRSCVASENEHHTMAIKSLCCADCLMGVYLFFIGAFDVKYCGEYNRHAHVWMESLSCQLIGSLALLSTEVSVMMLTYMTLEKYVCIVFPFHHYRSGRKRTLCSLTSIWALGFVLALAPFCDRHTFGNFYGRNGVCFPLHSDQAEKPGARCYSTSIFLGLNLFAFILIVFSYSSMFYSIQKTAKSARQTSFDLEVSVAKRFFFIVFTDAICWIPIFLLKILSLLQVQITGTLILWVVIFILPINSALNPILYTITTSAFQERLRVCVRFRCVDNH